MKTQHCFKFPWLKSAVHTGSVCAALFFLGAAPAAATHIQTTAELRAACEQSPGNVVDLDHSTKIFDGFPPPAMVHVSSGCTIVLGPGVNFETEVVKMTFAGPFVVQSAQKGEVKLTKSLMMAPSLTFSLVGAGSALAMSESSLQASSGSITAALGDDAKLEIYGRNLRGEGPSEALWAASSIQISGGRRFTGVIAANSGLNSVRALHGFRLTMDGGEGLLKVDGVAFYVDQGSIAITASGAKALVELHQTGFQFGDSAAVRLAGSDSGLKLKQVSFFGGPPTYEATGGVTLEVGSGSAGGGTLEASEVSVSVASVTMLASRSGQKGSLKLEKSHVSATGDIALETGAQGVTEVKENNGGSETRLRVAAGPGGNCVAQSNSFFAPVLEICP